VRWPLGLLGGLVALLSIAAPRVFVQGTSLAEGPWSGQAQCVLVTKGPDYEEEQTHTWRLTGDPPKPEGAFQVWPATWSVQGSGRRTVPSALEKLDAKREKPSEQWTIKAELNAPLSIWELAGRAGRLRINSRHGLLNAPVGSIQVTPSMGRPTSAAQQEWQFPVIEDLVTSTTLTGTSTRTLPAGFVFGWRQPRTVTTVETCTWNFARGRSASIRPELMTGRGRGTLSPATTASSTPPPRSIVMAGFTARGAAVTVAPRAITMTGFTATGSSVSVAPRIVTLPGFTAQGAAVAVPPRAISMPGFSAVGANTPGRGGRRK
jgi:hypothetical protein